MRDAKENSRKITGGQQSIHENLEKVVRKHFQNEYKKPVAQHTQNAFEKVAGRVEKALINDTPLLFDSFCGTAMSTRIIAKNNPSALVLGIDRSTARLTKTTNENLPDNVILVQAECTDFWLLANQAGWKLKKHFILYPNPYPKSKHLKRRCHAHPSYPTLLALGGEVELRTNWKVYADEFSKALEYANTTNVCCSGVIKLEIEEPLTLFEKKYQQGGHELYYCKYTL
jgi:tRNA (guanine-N7-)-methyltransferase